jgi:hypothetical protein
MMGASEKAVAAVMETLRSVLRDHAPVLLDARPWCMCGHKSETPALRERHLLEFLAVAAAAAVDTDRPSIQAQALRDAVEADAINILDVFRDKVPAVCVEDLLDRADRLEAQP